MSDAHVPSNLEPELRRCLEALDRAQTNITAYDVAYTTDPDVSVGAQLTTNIAAIAALAGGMQADQDYIITGLFQYDRGALAPFGVVSGAAYVPNLDSDKLDGYEGAELAALAEDETITGSWTFDAYTKFGTGTTTHALSASGDVLVSGKLEVDGAGYFDSTTSFFDQLNVDADIDFVNSTDQLKWTATKYITGTVGLELHDATLIQMYAPTSYFVGTAAAATLTVEFRRVSGATDSRLGVIGVADNFWTGTIAGDLVLQAIGAAKTLWLLAGNNVFKLGPTGLTTGAGGAGVDYTYTIDGQTNDYVETWDEGNDVMYTSDAWLFGDAARIYFEASGTTKGTEYIASANDEHLDLYANTSVDCNAALDMSGNHITSCASLALAEQSPVPASAAANTLVAYAEDIKGFSFLSTLDDTGMRRKMQRDSVIVVKNTTGSSIPALRAVYASGSEDDVPLVDKARSNNVATMPAIGVTLEAIDDGAYGRVMQIGLVENVDTSAFAAGDILYVSSTAAGIVVATPPLYPNVRQEIGTILAVDGSLGSVQVITRSMVNDGVTDHGGLLGLPDNDHPQYLLLSGGTMTGTAAIEFNAATEYINSGAAGYIDIYADTAVRAAASTFRCWDAVAPNLKVSTGQADATASSLVLGLATGGNQFVIGTGAGDSVLAAKTGGELFFAIGSAEVYRLVDTTTLRVKSTNQFQFNDAGTYIYSAANSFLDLVADGAVRVTGELQLHADNRVLSFGTGLDADIYYNATHLIIDPDVAGAGAVYIGATADDTICAAYFMPTTTRTEYYGSNTAGYNDIVAATATRIGDGGTTHYAEFKADGEIALHGTARVIGQFDVDLAVPKRPGANPPAEGTEDNFPTLDFDDTTDESVFFSVHLNHGYAAAGTVRVHVDFFVDTAPAAPANVVWGVEYKKVSHGDNFDFGAGTSTVTTIEAITTGTPANDKKIHETSALSFTTTGWASGDTIYMRLYRDADHASDTFTGDVRLIGKIHLEWLIDSLGEAT